MFDKKVKKKKQKLNKLALWLIVVAHESEKKNQKTSVDQIVFSAQPELTNEAHSDIHSRGKLSSKSIEAFSANLRNNVSFGT